MPKLSLDQVRGACGDVEAKPDPLRSRRRSEAIVLSICPLKMSLEDHWKGALSILHALISEKARGRRTETSFSFKCKFQIVSVPQQP